MIELLSVLERDRWGCAHGQALGSLRDVWLFSIVEGEVVSVRGSGYAYAPKADTWRRSWEKRMVLARHADQNYSTACSKPGAYVKTHIIDEGVTVNGHPEAWLAGCLDRPLAMTIATSDQYIGGIKVPPPLFRLGRGAASGKPYVVAVAR